MSNQSPKEKKGRKSHRAVIGIDEVGRGPLAGPITVCAFYIPDKHAHRRLKKTIFGNTIKDSKMLSKHSRINMYSIIRENRELTAGVKHALSSRSAAYIDRFGIVAAARACVRSCVLNLAKQGVVLEETEINLDAGLKVPMNGLQQADFVKGDERFLEIALASVVAKVSRDRHMERLAKKHVEYGWESNAGYGTPNHLKAIKIHGATKYHRRTFLKDFKPFEKPEN